MANNRALESLLEYLRVERGFDFTGYKRTSLSRRIKKRMAEVGLDDYGAYLDHLQVHPGEFDALFNTILINVTGFFRDAEAWAFLDAEVLPRLAEGDGPLRVWSAGCASGEEPYTLAMLLVERLGLDAFRERVKIYATDVDEEALATARQGVYPAQAVEAVPEALRERYFERSGGRYAFRNDLRRNVIFGRIDLVQQAPISRLDLLVCRNTLMYFDAETQARILARFHFALNDDGYLFLGRAEMLLTHGHLFRPVDMQTRVFSKVSKPNLRDRILLLSQTGRPAEGERVAREVRLREAAFHAAPVAQIVLDADDALALANDRARALFDLQPEDLGRPFKDIELSYRPAELRSIIERVRGTRLPETVPNVTFTPAGGRAVHLEVQVVPLNGDNGHGTGTSILFHDVTETTRLQDDLRRSKADLETAYEELQSTNEELETTNEELQSTVEELETTNEELQSTNEELETMNEELQSTNEELETMNEELRLRTEETNQVTALIEGIFSSLQTAMVVLDRRLRVTLWRGLARDLWGLTPDEAEGEPFFGLDIGLPVNALRSLVERCRAGDLARGEEVIEAVDRRGRKVRCRVVGTPLREAPFCENDGEPQGVILVMENWSEHDG